MLALRTILIYPFLIGIWPILTYYQANLGFWMPFELIETLLILAVAIALLMIIIGSIWKDWDKAAVMTSLLAIACFSYSCVKPLIDPLLNLCKPGTPLGLVRLAIYVLIWTPIFCLFGKLHFKLGSHKIPIDLKSARFGLNIFSALMVAVLVWSIIGDEVKQNTLAKKTLESNYRKDEKVQFGHIQSRPDIYYIILDGYAHSKTFSDYYYYDNSDFMAFLKKHGFYVAAHSSSNHDRTALSIPSSLDMQCLTHLKTELGNDYSAYSVPNILCQNSRIIHLLRSQGYKFVNLCTLFPPTAFIPGADFNIGFPVSGHLPAAMLVLSLVSETESQFHFIRDLYALNRLCLFHKIDQLKMIHGPKFVLAHCLLTHPPFIFNSKGEKLPVPIEHLMIDDPFDPPQYIEQVKFAESIMKPLIHDLANQNPKPIIILQSDHGPATVPITTTSSSRAEKQKYINSRMRILNAYFLPPGGSKIPYQSITPINTFRLILNSYFGTNLSMLPDESFLSFPDEPQFRFRNVTKDIEFKEK